jgi:hypothetical protein
MLVTNQVIQRNIITNQTTLATSNNTLRSLFFIFLVGFRTKYVHNLVVLVTAFMGFSGYRAFSTAFPRPAMLGLAAAYFRRSQALPMLAGSATNNSCTSVLMLCPAPVNVQTVKPAKSLGLGGNARYSGGGEAQLDVLLRFLETCLQSRVSIVLLRSQYSLLQQDAVVDILSLRARLEF